MADEIPQGEWVELPEDKLKDLDLPEEAAAEVKGGAVDMFLKLDGRSAFLKYGSKIVPDEDADLAGSEPAGVPGLRRRRGGRGWDLKATEPGGGRIGVYAGEVGSSGSAASIRAPRSCHWRE